MRQEYIPQMTFPIDHIIATQHGGTSTPDNLCLSCLRCNLQKGPNIAGLDPETGELVPIFHPRKQIWNEHFVLNGPFIEGISPVGRTTVKVLAFNHEQQVDLREALLADGWAFD